MSKVNSNEEILEFAIAKEVEAYHFYMALAGRVDDPKMQQVFQDLAEEELEHKAKLELEITKLGRTISTELKPGRSGDGYILIDGAAVLDMDYKDALLLAMEKEDTAFRIYVNLAGTVADEQSQEMLLGLAQEEVRHKLRFEAEYDALSKKV
ncbi:MAG: ferritin family protein [Planctomycetota bacterium]|jgi:rubrerythrin